MGVDGFLQSLLFFWPRLPSVLDVSLFEICLDFELSKLLDDLKVSNAESGRHTQNRP